MSEKLSVVDPQSQAHAMAELEIGQTVLYTQQISRGEVRERAAVVTYVLDDGRERRPVLRVFVPNAPMLPGMPKEGLTMAAGLTDIEVYGPEYNPDSSVPNTWRPISATA